MYLIALISIFGLISTLLVKEGLDARQIEEIKVLEEKQNKAFEEEKDQERWKFFVPDWDKIPDSTKRKIMLQSAELSNFKNYTKLIEAVKKRAPLPTGDIVITSDEQSFYLPGGHSFNVVIDRSKGPGTLKKIQTN
jgi:hypothetical protein